MKRHFDEFKEPDNIPRKLVRIAPERRRFLEDATRNRCHRVLGAYRRILRWREETNEEVSDDGLLR